MLNGNGAFQWSHFCLEMDRLRYRVHRPEVILVFQWSHFCLEMDRKNPEKEEAKNTKVSMEPLLSRNG